VNMVSVGAFTFATGLALYGSVKAAPCRSRGSMARGVVHTHPGQRQRRPGGQRPDAPTKHEQAIDHMMRNADEAPRA